LGGALKADVIKPHRTDSKNIQRIIENIA
jgi:hypothetical protein